MLRFYLELLHLTAYVRSTVYFLCLLLQDCIHVMKRIRMLSVFCSGIGTRCYIGMNYSLKVVGSMKPYGPISFRDDSLATFILPW